MSTLAALVAAALSIAGIALVQPSLAANVKSVKQRDDVYALPPPDAMKAIALGYDSAGADLIWAKLILEYGNHWSDRKYFREAPRFIDDIIALDPKHRTLYTFVDTILIYQPTSTNVSRGDADDFRAAKKYLNKGLEAFPYDGELWLHYGQFVAFNAPAFLTDRDEIERDRLDGAKAMGHAMELGTRVDRTMAAASMLGRAGETKATIAYLERAYALTDDEGERQKILAQLHRYQDVENEDARTRALRIVEATWRKTFSYLTREQFLLLSPAPNPATCAGPQKSGSRDCLESWATVVNDLGP